MSIFSNLDLWALIALVLPCLGLFLLVIQSASQTDGWIRATVDSAIESVRGPFGLGAVPGWLIMIGTAIWGLLLVTFVVVIVGMVLVPFGISPVGNEDFSAVRITGATAVLAALVALPLTLRRLSLTDTQTRTAAEALLNDKINAAATALAARRQETREVEGGDKKEVQTLWQDDIVTRASAIDRLEGLAEENPTIARRVARMLSIYVQELSREYPAVPVPEGASPKELSEWARGLRPARPDMQRAAQSLGRLKKKIENHGIGDGDIDLRDCNLQGFDLQGADFKKALLSGAQMQGAFLKEAQLQRAKLWDARMQGTILWRAQMQGAILSGAQMQAARLSGAQMKGAKLSGAKMQGAILRRAQIQGTDLTVVQMHGANLSGAQMQGAKLRGVKMDAETSLGAKLLGAGIRNIDDATRDALRRYWRDLFADGSVQVPTGERPAHWADEILLGSDFDKKWREWQSTLPPGWDGRDPDQPGSV